jgi:hypothetical protein
MGLAPDDRLPEGISIRDAYAAIRIWYQANVDLYAVDPQRGDYVVESKAYIESLPPPEQWTREAMEDTLQRVLSRDLEWGYHESDGKFKMAAYAHAAFATAGINPFGGDSAPAA